MGGTVVSAGPFVGGLNTLSDPGAIGDTELVVCQNFEVDPDGALKTRPPFVVLPGNTDYPSTAGFRLLGTYSVPGATYLIASGGSRTMYFTGQIWSDITTTFAAAAIQQFNGTLYLLAPTNSDASSGYWTFGGTFTADAKMPRGTAIVSYKSRLWVATGGSGIQYSSVVPDTNFWTVGSTYGGTFQVAAADGQSNVGLLVLSSTLLIFRTSSIWQFSYSSDPGFGSQSVLVPDVGLASADALTVFEGTAYFMYDGKAYVLNGASAQQLNTMVPFVATLRSNCYLPFAVSVLGRRIVFTYYDTMYVWNLRSRTWTTWTTPTYVGIGRFQQLSGASTADSPVYITHSNFLPSANQHTLRFTDGYSADAEPTFNAILQTKTFDYATPAQMKRLFYWGIDAVFKSAMIGSVIPELFSSRVTWGQLLQTSTWGKARNFTWGQPSTASLDTTTTATPDIAGVYPTRKFVKLGKSLRSRRLIYRIQIPVDGSVSTSPAKVFGIETVIAVKELVSKQIS